MALAERCPNLETVYLQHSPLVTEAALTTLAQRCPKLDLLKVCEASMDKAAIARICRERVRGLGAWKYLSGSPILTVVNGITG
jgi:hypothetical protein